MMMPLSRIKFQIAPLVNEMLDQLPDHVWTSSTTTFLDPAMGGGQFLVEIERRLAGAGHSDDNISTRVFGCERNQLRLNYSKMFTKLRTNNLFVSDGLSHDWGDMKFDVILGNPPYQNGNEKGGKSSLWRKFVSMSWKILNQHGHMAMVVPRLPNDANDLGHIFVDHQTTHVWKDVSHFFPRVGSSFSAWIVCKAASHAPTLFVQEDVCMQLTSNKLPKLIKAVSILDKFENWSQKIDVVSSSQYKHTSVADGKDDKHLSSKRSKKLCYQMRRTNGDNKYMWGAVEPDDYKKSKITFTYSGYPGFTYHTKNDSVGTIGFMSGHVLVKNKSEASSLISLYESNAYKFVREQVSAGGMKGQKTYQQPLLPLDRIWSDAEVYTMLKLTNDEILLIESNQ